MVDQFKQAIRQTCLQIRKNLSQRFQIQASTHVITRIKQSLLYQQANKIGFYIAVHGEVNLEPLWKEAAKMGKQCYFPTITEHGLLKFMRADEKTAFTNNRYGILEPISSVFLPASELELVIVPLVAFDEQGNRIGMGKGYYDKTFANTPRPMLMGVAYEFQKQTFIAPEAWDIPLDIIVTEKNNYSPRN